VRVWRNERAALAATFIQAAGRYWLSVYPHVRRELRHWRLRAERIPDPMLRRLALLTQREERGNLRGAAAFAVLAPRGQRACVVRAVVAFQAIYDYADTLAEQPNTDAAKNGEQLHRALLNALDPQADHGDYYAYSLRKQDGGYLRDLVESCRTAWGALPSHAALGFPVVRAIERMIAFQSFNHGSQTSPEGNDGKGAEDGIGGDGARDGNDGEEDRWGALAAWAEQQTPPESGLRWWETGAAGASSLTVFALIVAAAETNASAEDTVRIEQVYFPWIGALHLLLDSLVDQQGDLVAGRNSLVEHYSSREELADRLNAIAIEALRLTKTLPQSSEHALIFAAMVSFYLAQPQASSADAAPARVALLATLGERGALSMPVMRMLEGRRWWRHGSL
jgi:tetraprenyl-beta-curcumene synthase